MAHHRGGHQPDRAGAGDEDVLAEDRERERGVHRVAERVEHRRHVEVDVALVLPDVAGRYDEVLGERAGPGQPDAVGVRAQVASTGPAVAAAAAHDVALGADQIAHGHLGDLRAELDDLADELVADHHRHRHVLGGPLIPRVDVQVGAADSGAEHPDEYLTRGRGRAEERR